MHTFIQFLFWIFSGWLVLYGVMKFYPQYAVQLPKLLYSFLYLLTQWFFWDIIIDMLLSIKKSKWTKLCLREFFS